MPNKNKQAATSGGDSNFALPYNRSKQRRQRSSFGDCMNVHRNSHVDDVHRISPQHVDVHLSSPLPTKHIFNPPASPIHGRSVVRSPPPAVRQPWVWGTDNSQGANEVQRSSTDIFQGEKKPSTAVKEGSGMDGKSSNRRADNDHVIPSSEFDSSCSTEAPTECPPSARRESAGNASPAKEKGPSSNHTKRSSLKHKLEGSALDAAFLIRLSDMSLRFPDAPTRSPLDHPAKAPTSKISSALATSGWGKGIAATLPSLQVVLPSAWHRGNRRNKRRRKSTALWIARSKKTSSMAEASAFSRRLYSTRAILPSTSSGSGDPPTSPVQDPCPPNPNPYTAEVDALILPQASALSKTPVYTEERSTSPAISTRAGRVPGALVVDNQQWLPEVGAQVFPLSPHAAEFPSGQSNTRQPNKPVVNPPPTSAVSVGIPPPPPPPRLRAAPLPPRCRPRPAGAEKRSGRRGTAATKGATSDALTSWVWGESLHKPSLSHRIRRVSEGYQADRRQHQQQQQQQRAGSGQCSVSRVGDNSESARFGGSRPSSGARKAFRAQ